MLRIHLHRNQAAARSYYTSAAEYYGAGQQELVGEWGGKAADRLGLAGEVLEEHFGRVLGNRDPFTGEQLTARMRKDRRVAYDFNFHVCKSLSLLYALTDDPDILAALRWAVAETMREIEKGVTVRVRKRGQFGERVAGNLAYAEFPHLTARPVNGVTDPHLHIHCVVPNVCWDAVESMWKAIDVASVKEDAPHWQALFHRTLGRRLERMGFAVVWQGDSFEIEGVERATIDKFSGRTGHINRVAEKRGITDPGVKDGLGARTRESKRRDATLRDLRAEWRQRMTDEERAALGQAALRRRHPLPGADRRAGGPAYRQAHPPAARGGGHDMIRRLRARAKAARPELDAWEQERRDWVQQQPARKAATNQGRAR